MIYTKGPWKFYQFEVMDEMNRVIAILAQDPSGPSIDEFFNNGKLIRAAPEMYELLKKIAPDTLAKIMGEEVDDDDNGGII